MASDPNIYQIKYLQITKVGYKVSQVGHYLNRIIGT